MNFDNGNLDNNPELNITPLVDIMLVLLAILMLAVPSVVYKEDINLPKGSKSSKSIKDKNIEIILNKKGEIFINNKNYDASTFADEFMLFSHNFDKQLPIYIRADKDLKYDNIIFVLKSVKEAGFVKVALVTNA